MSHAAIRLGYHALSVAEIPAQAALETGHHDVAGRKTLKLERKTVIWSDPIPSEGVNAIYKMYRNRGGISWQREQAFRFRVEREYNALSFLAARGVPCSQARFWTFGCHKDHGRHEILCMKEIPDVVPVVEAWPKGIPAQGTALPAHKKEIDIIPLCGVIRRMHESGFYHGRLDLRNILVGSDAAGVFHYHIIDTPQAILFPRSIVGTRMGWADLRHFVLTVSDYWGADASRAILFHYGSDEETTARMIKDIDRGEPSLLARNLMRFEFGIRSRLAFRRDR